MVVVFDILQLQAHKALVATGEGLLDAACTRGQRLLELALGLLRGTGVLCVKVVAAACEGPAAEDVEKCVTAAAAAAVAGWWWRT